MNNNVILTSGRKSTGLIKYKDYNIYYYRKWNTGETIYKPIHMHDCMPEFNTVDEARQYVDDYEKLLHETMKKYNGK